MPTIIKKLILFASFYFVCCFAYSQKQQTVIHSDQKKFTMQWNIFKKCILSKNVNAVISFFSDSLKNNFSDGENNNLKTFISKRWINNKYFIQAIKRTNDKIERVEEFFFEVKILIQYPKVKHEEGDATMLYVLKFRKNGEKIQIFDIKMAG